VVLNCTETPWLIGWSILVCAGVFLYLTLVPSRRRGDRLPLQNG
jgi:hypothetical protein